MDLEAGTELMEAELERRRRLRPLIPLDSGGVGGRVRMVDGRLDVAVALLRILAASLRDAA